jgi:hypothetical protein
LDTRIGDVVQAVELLFSNSKALSSIPRPTKTKKKERKKSIKKKKEASRVPMAHACNPRYSEGRDREDHGSKPAWANSS